ncbi:sodium transporter [Echinicola strongylocentroti]|uniref:Sodium transporter n=1 Tax=Echinicola strongylocentroti TaxID=1795355 RepID=A0A2Z4IFQ4_9BACT|nr:sodium:solute symporter family protein [Echinicola strongylocentroti]AWW29609.1 sodium transporter [Echinicola strongylocentroti]
MQEQDYILIGVFTLIVLSAGLAFARTGRSMANFFAGGGNVPWWISGLSLFMSFFSAGTFVVWGSIAYDQGMVAVTIQSMMAIAGLIIYFTVARKWKEANVLTAAEYVTHRFGVKTQKIYSYLFIAVSFFTAGSFLYPVAKIVSVSAQVPITLIILILGITIVLYTAVGGFWAVLATDVLQFVVLTAAVFIVIPLALDEVGGMDGFIAQSPEGFFGLINSEFSPMFLVAFMLYNFVFIGGNWAYVQRYTSVKSPKEAKKVALLFAGFYLVFPLIWMLPPMIYKVYDPGLVTTQQMEGAYLMMCAKALPIGMLGLMIAAMVFATASSVNTTLNMMAAVTTNDLYKSIHPQASEKQLIKVARWVTVVFGLGVMGVAMLVPYLGGIVNVVLKVAAVTGAPLFAPILWSLYSRRQDSRSVIITSILSIVGLALIILILPSVLDYEVSRSMEMTLGVAVPVCMLILFEIKNRPVLSGEKAPVTIGSDQEVEEVERSGDDTAFGIKVISIATGMIGLIMTGLGIIASKGNEMLVAAGIIMVLMASAGLYFGKKKSKN